MSDHLIPPSVRSHVALGLTASAALGRFELQVCDSCGAVQYPPRETCVKCLSDQLTWREHSGRGELIAATAIHHSNHAYFGARTPWNIGMVRLEGDITVLAHLHHACMSLRNEVRVRALLDRGGRGVLFAFPVDGGHTAESDSQVLEMTCTPKHKRVLVTDGNSELGRALIEFLLAAEADVVWSGTRSDAEQQPATATNVQTVLLDVTSDESVAAAATRLGPQADIIINNADVHGDAQDEINTNYLGLLRLATAFVPHLLARAHEKRSPPTAWVNVLSIYALCSHPSHGTYSASKSAALSLSQCLRAQLRTSGIRVLNVFPGPTNELAFRDVPRPKLAPRALAKAIVAALECGQEDCYPGEVAQDVLRRWRQDPKVLELELQP